EAGVSETPATEAPSDFLEEVRALGLTAIPLETRQPPSCYISRGLVWDPFSAWDADELKEKKEALTKSASSFSLDLVPRLLFGRSE
ncbi:unnamed protein product, partial [Polarella glacialis]